MLVQKLLRLEDTLIQEVEVLAQEMSKTEYTSFSSLVRQLIRKGLDIMQDNTIQEQSFINKIKEVSSQKNTDVQEVVIHIKHLINASAMVGYKSCYIVLHQLIAEIICVLAETRGKTNMSYWFRVIDDALNIIMQEGFAVSAYFNSSVGVKISW